MLNYNFHARLLNFFVFQTLFSTFIVGGRLMRLTFPVIEWYLILDQLTQLMLLSDDVNRVGGFVLRPTKKDFITHILYDSFNCKWRNPVILFNLSFSDDLYCYMITTKRTFIPPIEQDLTRIKWKKNVGGHIYKRWSCLRDFVRLCVFWLTFLLVRKKTFHVKQNQKTKSNLNLMEKYILISVIWYCARLIRKG